MMITMQMLKSEMVPFSKGQGETNFPLVSCTMKHKRWVRYELVEFFGGPKVLNSENLVYKINFGRKKRLFADNREVSLAQVR